MRGVVRLYLICFFYISLSSSLDSSLSHPPMLIITFNVQSSTFKVQRSKFNVQCLPKNSINT